MSRPSYAFVLEPSGKLLQDRVKVIAVGEALVIAVADGAGGIYGSEHASEAVIQGIESWIVQGRSLEDEETWSTFLEETDGIIAGVDQWGQTTAVVLAVTERWICGASVGDSEAWLATVDDFSSITSCQFRKPFLGSGAARIVSFRTQNRGGTLIVGTDGLFKYAPVWKICELARDGTPESAAQAILSRVRLPSGQLQDDIGFVICRIEIKIS